MAGDAREVRIEERLKIKIAEAKNLPPRGHGALNHRDTYCVLSLDQEEIFRTATKEKTLAPFFGEEFQFEVPRHFRFLSIYVFDKDRDRPLKQDKVLGKVAIKREELQQYNNKDYWFALKAVDADSEVQGKAHIEIKLEEHYPKITSLSPDQDVSAQKLFVKNMEHNDGGKGSLTEMTASNLSVDYKTSKSKKISEYCKENIKFGSCSSSSSRKLLSAVTIDENLSSLARSDSLRSAGLHHTCRPRNKQISMNMENLRSQQSLNTFLPLDTYVHPSLDSDYSPECNSYTSGDQPSFESWRPSHQMACKNKLSIKVLECSELTMKNGQCDPYAEVTVIYANDKKVSQRTKVRKKTVNPKFDECFVFDLVYSDSCSKEKGGSNAYTVWSQQEAEACEVCISLWHEGHPTFLGEVRASLKTSPHQAAINGSAWYCLQSRSASQQCPRGATPPGTRLSSMASSTSLGSLRLQLHHTLDRVLPAHTYDSLKALLLKSPKPITASAVYILGEIASSKTDAAQPLVRLFTNEDKLVPIIEALAEAELSTLTDPTTIFRGNTLVSKMMDEAMRLTGIMYLKQTVKPVLDVIMSEKKVCEIDPTRVKDLTTIESNLVNLKEYVEKMFGAITNSYMECPPIMSRLFDVLRQCAAHRFPENQDVKYSVVSGFIFLRFFAPAILGPRLFDLTAEQIDPQTHRTLTLISKTMQSLGNLTSSQACKEEYMVALFKSFTTERHIQAIKSFLEIISNSRMCEKQSSNNFEKPVVFKEGTMMKRSEGRKPFRRSNLKQRHFRLTSCELSYSKALGKKTWRSIPLKDISQVEAVPDAHNLNMNNMFQIKYKDCILYVQASNCVERKDWLFLLSKLCEGNISSNDKYHPGAFTHSRWTCCLSNASDAVGCVSKEGGTSPTSPPPPPNLRLGLDPARDLQRIHCLLFSHINIIENLLIPALPGCQQSALAASIPVEQCGQFNATLREMLDVTYRLEAQHRAHQRTVARETKYGSKQAPIGDDNYLNLGARPNANAIDSQHPMDDTYRMLHSATVPSLHATISPSSSRHLLPYASPSLPPKFEKAKSMFSSTDKGFSLSYPRELSSCKNTIPEKCVGKTDSTYLNNSLYHSSSTESMKGREMEDKNIARMSNSSNSGYLVMSSLSRSDDSREDCNITNNISSPTQDLIRKDRISPGILQQKSATVSEYIEVRPKVPERDTKPIANPAIPPKLPTKPKALMQEDPVDSSHYSCAEYELMANFSSAIKHGLNLDGSRTDDNPPAVPPRSHTYTPPKTPPKQEYKSFDHYQLKGVTHADKRVTLRIVEDGDEIEERLSAKDTTKCQTFCESNVGISDMDCDSLKLPASNSTGVVGEQCLRTQDLPGTSCSISERKEQCPGAAGQTKQGTEEATNKKQKNKEDNSGFFSRKNVQRKSIPKPKKPNSEPSSSVSSRTSEPMEPTKSALTDRLTPSFFKKKAKVTTTNDNVRLPPIC